MSGFVPVGGTSLPAGRALTALDGSFKVQNSTDTTKQFAWSLSGMTTGKTLTLAGNQTTDQTLNVPNLTASDTMATLGLAQTFTAAKTFTGGATFTTAGLTITDVNITLGTTTGTKIGTATTQKLGFFNAAPIAQPTGAALTALSNLGLIASPTLAASDITSGTLAAARGGTGVSNAGTITCATDFTVLNGGMLDTGGFTLTVPATMTAAGLGIANVFTASQTISGTSSAQITLTTTTTGNSYYQMSLSDGDRVFFGIGSGVANGLYFNTTAQVCFGGSIVAGGTSYTAGNGLLQLASGTTKAYGWACGTDVFGFRNGAAGFTLDATAGLTLTGPLILPTHTPSSASDTGTTGQIAWDSSYLYVCTASNTWKRVGIATW